MKKSKAPFKGKQKQTEGFTPRSAMPGKKRAGKESARDKRLAKAKM